MEITEIQTKIGKVKANLKSEKFRRNLAMTNIVLCTVIAPNIPGMDNSFSKILFTSGTIVGALALSVCSQNIGSMKNELSSLEEKRMNLK